MPSGGGSALKHSTEGLEVTCKTVGNVFPRSAERAKNTLNTSLPSPLIGPVGCSHAIFTLLLESTATCGKADGRAADPEGAMLTPGVKVLPPSSERLKKIPSEFGPGFGPPDQTT